MRVATQRLASQHLASPTVKNPSDLVSLFAGVQAQDYGGAKWGIAQRTVGVTDAQIEREVGAGRILRTHVLRPTWHFVAATDIRWLLALSAPRIRASLASYDRRLGIDDEVRRRTRAVLSKELRNRKQLTRSEVAKALTEGGVHTEGTQRLAHLMMHAELDGMVCSGARRGKQFTYALVDECVPATKEMERDAALHTLATRYFTTRGPATEDDFAWWSGLRKADARAAVASIDKLDSENIDGRRHWFLPSATKRLKSIVRLLPAYDEYMVSYADRGAMHQRVDPKRVGEAFDFLGSYVVTIDGQIVGRCKRTVGKERLSIRLEPLTRLTGVERNAIEREAARFAAFLELPFQIEVVTQKAARRRL